jgi:low temperature requirement protein LtrA
VDRGIRQLSPRSVGDRQRRSLGQRHAVFIILSIGESVVAVGEGAGGQAIRGPLIVGSILGVGLAVCLWWLYFDVVSIAAEHDS